MANYLYFSRVKLDYMRNMDKLSINSAKERARWRETESSMLLVLYVQEVVTQPKILNRTV